jgi:hypothetical protein
MAFVHKSIQEEMLVDCDLKEKLVATASTYT